MLFVNQGNQAYPVERGGWIAQLVIEKINNEELQEVAELDDTMRGNQGISSSNIQAQSGKDQSVKDQSAKPRIEINEISARAFGQFYWRGEVIGILRWDEVHNEIQLKAINISKELAIKNQKNNEDKDTRDIVLREYHHLLDVFEKGEKTMLPPHRQGVDLGIDIEEGKMVPIKKIWPVSNDQIEELHRYLKQNQERGWIRRVRTGLASPIRVVKKKYAKLRLYVDYSTERDYQKKLTPTTTYQGSLR